MCGPEAEEEHANRMKKAYRDAVAGPEEPSNWTNFDIRRSLQALRFGNPEHIKITLRKLHIRFWHAPATAMKKLLQRAGIPSHVLRQVDEVVHTCAEFQAIGAASTTDSRVNHFCGRVQLPS